MSYKILPLVLLFCLITACKPSHNQTSETQNIARVGSHYLTRAEARQAIPDFNRKDSALAISRYRDQWIHRQILLQEARRLNLSNQKQVQMQLQQARTEVLLEALRRSIAAKYRPKSKVSRREALNYYRRHKNKLTLEERYLRYRLIETEKLADARKARRLLKNDSAWVSVAKDYSSNAEQNIKQSKYFWPISTVKNSVSALKNTVATLDSGAFSPIRRSQKGFQFIEVTGVRQQGTTADPDWFVKQLKTWLIHKKKRSYYESYIKNLYLMARKNNEITIYHVK